MSIQPYLALPLQCTCDAVNMLPSTQAAREQMLATIKRIDGLIKGSMGFASTFNGLPVRLVVLPEYFLTSFPLGESIPAWIEKASLQIDGPEYAALSKLAQDSKIFLSGNAYECDPHFPELYFQTSFIIDDSGDVILRYRRLISMFAPTPHDVLDAYLDQYGPDSLFPVVDTELGRLACIASEEILYPEISRALALNGAEVICHSSSEVASPRSTPKNIAKQARAYENMMYVVSANSASIDGIPFPAASTDLSSQVVNYKGAVLAEAASGESMAGCAEIDIAALRSAREKPAMTNTLARQRLELFENVYKKPVYAANTMLDDGEVIVPDRSHFVSCQEEAIESLKKRWSR